MVELKFVKVGKEYMVYDGDKEVGKMYKDNKRNYQYAVVVKWKYKTLGSREEVTGKTYKQVKIESQKVYNDFLEKVKNGKEIIENPHYNLTYDMATKIIIDKIKNQRYN